MGILGGRFCLRSGTERVCENFKNQILESSRFQGSLLGHGQMVLGIPAGPETQGNPIYIIYVR